jgi:hypothetical protein
MISIKTIRLLICVTYTFILLGCRSDLKKTTQIDGFSSTNEIKRTVEYNLTQTYPKDETPTSTISTSTVSPKSTSTGYPIIATFPKCPAFDTLLPYPDTPDNYIGHHYDLDRLPDGLTIEYPDGLWWWRAPDDISVDYILRNDNQIMVWLKRLICRDPIDLYWEIIDVIALPPLNEDEEIGSTCFKGGIMTDISAIGTFYDKSPLITINDVTGWQLTNLRFAWHINTNELRFIEDSVDGLVCLKLTGRG